MTCPDINITENIDNYVSAYEEAMERAVRDGRCLSEYQDIKVLPAVTLLKNFVPYIPSSDVVLALVTPGGLTLPTIRRIIELLLKYKAIRLRSNPSRPILTIYSRPFKLSQVEEAISNMPRILFTLAKMIFIQKDYKAAYRLAEEHGITLYSNQPDVVEIDSDVGVSVYYEEDYEDVLDDLPYKIERLVLMKPIEAWP